MIVHHSVDRVVVPLETRDYLSLLVAHHLHDADVGVRAADGAVPGVLVDGHGERDGVPAVDLHELLDHADVPGLQDAVRVAGGDVVAAHAELGVLDGVQVPVEGLDGQACAHVPDREGAVRGTRDEKVRVGLERERVYGVCVRTILLSLLQSVKIKKLNGTVTPS